MVVDEAILFEEVVGVEVEEEEEEEAEDIDVDPEIEDEKSNFSLDRALALMLLVEDEFEIVEWVEYICFRMVVGVIPELTEDDVEAMEGDLHRLEIVFT